MNVRPGEHLAVPDEDGVWTGPVLEVQVDDGVAEVYYDEDDNTAGTTFRPARDDHSAQNNTIRPPRFSGIPGSTIRPVSFTERGNDAGDAPRWLSGEADANGHYKPRENLSYQQYSALRIRTATIAPSTRPSNALFTPTQLAPIYEDEADGASNVPLARFTSGPVTNASVKPEITVTRDRNILDHDFDLASLPVIETTTLVLPSLESDDELETLSAVRGRIIDVENSCAILKADDNSLVRLYAPEQIHDLSGKQVTVWGEKSDYGPCGEGVTLAVDHTVYGEAWVK